MERPLYQRIASLLQAVRNCEKSGNVEWKEKHTDSILELVKNQMPSGSGFDNGTTFDFDKSTPEKLFFNTAFHHMDENGFYSGWTEHTVKVTASLTHGIDLTISGKDRNGIKEIIDAEFMNALEEKA